MTYRIPLLFISLSLFSTPLSIRADDSKPPQEALPTPPKAGDPTSLQYNVDLPTGDQRQPVYFTKDLTFKVGSTEIGFYGFIKVDYLGENRIAGTTGDVILNLVPIDTDLADRRTQSLLDARSSRLGLKIEDSIGGVAMKGAAEGDFATVTGDAINSNSRTFRLRLAYATAELPSHFFFLVGQYYGLPMHYPEIDMPTRVNLLHYPAGVIDCRQPQFRIGYKKYGSCNRLFQFECNAEAQGYNNANGFVTPEGGDPTQASEQKWPLFNAKLAYLSESFKCEVVGSASRSYLITNSIGDRVGTDVWGVTSSASYTWKDLIVWGTVHHLVGLSGLSSNYLRQVALIDGTELEAAKANGGAIALRYDFIKKSLWADIMYGIEHVNEIPGSPFFTGTSLKKIEDFRVNLVGAFWKHWQIGLEYERVHVEAFNGTPGCDNMFHLGVWYIFGQP